MQPTLHLLVSSFKTNECNLCGLLHYDYHLNLCWYLKFSFYLEINRISIQRTAIKDFMYKYFILFCSCILHLILRFWSRTFLLCLALRKPWSIHKLVQPSINLTLDEMQWPILVCLLYLDLHKIGDRNGESISNQRKYPLSEQMFLWNKLAFNDSGSTRPLLERCQKFNTKFWWYIGVFVIVGPILFWPLRWQLPFFLVSEAI